MQSIAWVLLVLAGCSKDHSITGPGGGGDMAAMWPNADGTSWTYASTLRSWDPPANVPFPTLASVPAVTFDTVAAVLAAHPTGTHAVTDTAALILSFNGTALLASGLTAQVLESTTLPKGPPNVAQRGIRRAERFGARPGFSPLAVVPARFLHGGYWHRNSGWIGTYDPVASDTLPDWKFLESNLVVGHEFFWPLAPELASNIGLHARIVRRLTVQTPGGPIANGIEVHYYIDYGVEDVRDDNGNLIGYQRPFTCASIQYAPGIGPVRDDERLLLYVGQSRGAGEGELSLELRHVDASPVAIRAAPGSRAASLRR